MARERVCQRCACAFLTFTNGSGSRECAECFGKPEPEPGPCTGNGKGFSMSPFSGK